MTNKIKVCFLIILSICLFTFIGCDTSEGIQKKYEENGYSISTLKGSDSIVQNALKLFGLSEEQKQAVAGYDVIVATKGLNNATILKAPTAGDIKSLLTIVNEDGTKDLSKYEEAKKNNLINGNCLLLIASDNAKLLFK